MPHVAPAIVAMMRLQACTGMRPSEVLCMRPIDIAGKRNGLWYYRPVEHKTQQFGKDRVVMIGPKGQELLRPYLDRGEAEYCFQPRENPSPRNRSKRDRYSYSGYQNAVRRAIERANKKRLEKDLEPIPQWSPNQLRKLHGQRIRDQFGLDAAQLQLGHSQSATTDRYYTVPGLQAAEEAQRHIG